MYMECGILGVIFKGILVGSLETELHFYCHVFAWYNIVKVMKSIC